MQKITTLLKSASKGRLSSGNNACTVSADTNQSAAGSTYGDTGSALNRVVPITSNQSPRARLSRRLFGKSKSAAVSRSASSQSRSFSTQMYLHSSDERLSTSTTDSDDDELEIVHQIDLSAYRPVTRCQLADADSDDQASDDEVDEDENEPSDSDEESRDFKVKPKLQPDHVERVRCTLRETYKRPMALPPRHVATRVEPTTRNDKPNKDRFKLQLIKSKSSSALQAVKSFTKSFENRSGNGSTSEQSTGSIKSEKGSKSKKSSKQSATDLNGQLELSQLAERLRFIEQKLLENERNVDRKLEQICRQTSTEKADESTNRHSSSSFASDNVFENQRLCPSASADDCTKFMRTPNAGKHYKSRSKMKKEALKSTAANSRSIPSLLPTSDQKSSAFEVLALRKASQTADKKMTSSRHSSQFTNGTITGNGRCSTGSVDVSAGSRTSWRTPFNVIGNIVDERILKGRWNSSKSIRSSSSSGSIRSNSVCSALSATIPVSTGSAAGSIMRNSIDTPTSLESSTTHDIGRTRKVSPTNLNKEMSPSNWNAGNASGANGHNRASNISNSWLHWPIQDEQALLEPEVDVVHYDRWNQASVPVGSTNCQHRLSSAVDALAEIEAFERLLSANLSNHK